MKGVERVDLAACGEAVLVKQCDVCIVGAGAAGIYLAVALASRGVDVVLLEAGGPRSEDAAAIGFAAQFDAEVYPGATAGRFFGLGGSTSRWGGLLIPHTRLDARETTEAGADAWPHIVRTVADKTTPVLNTLGWRGEAGFTAFAQSHLGQSGEALGQAGLDVAAGLFLPFRKKNFVSLLGKKSGNGSRLRIVYNAMANGWQTEPDAETAGIRQAQAVSHNGKRLDAAARHFVIAAGAIESARILLELDQSSPRPVIREGAAIGCYLADHLSLAIADVATDSVATAIRCFAPRFANGWMRSFRFLEANPPADAPRAFAHFIFDNKNPGFALAKEALGALQGRRWPELSAADVASGLGGLARLGYQRYAHTQLYIPPDTATHLQLDIEQVPVRENRIQLGDGLDRYGRRIVRIHWRISERDTENIRLTAQRFLEKWSGGNAFLPALSPQFDGCNAKKPHDAYHPVGTCRMGKDSEAVVDKDLKVHGLRNLWVVSTGVLPSAGTANPTFTMLCLAERLAEQLVQ